MRKGLSSLPDEVLAVILEVAAYSSLLNEEQAAIQTVKAAIKLSHTSQRIRGLVVKIPNLWNNIFSTMPPQMVSACCDHLTIANAEVIMPFSSASPIPPTTISHFIRTTSNHAKYWRRCVHRRSWYPINSFSADNLEENCQGDI